MPIISSTCIVEMAEKHFSAYPIRQRACSQTPSRHPDPSVDSTIGSWCEGTGAIIAPLVGLGLSVDEIARLYCKHVVEIMSRWPPGWKNAALEELASKVFGDPKFDAFKSKMGGWG